MPRIASGHAEFKDRCVVCETRTNNIIEWSGGGIRVFVFACEKHREALSIANSMDPVIRTIRVLAQTRSFARNTFDDHKAWKAEPKPWALSTIIDVSFTWMMRGLVIATVVAILWAIVITWRSILCR